jgi:hypothetical protein
VGRRFRNAANLIDSWLSKRNAEVQGLSNPERVPDPPEEVRASL